ncbi:hypothetical protein Lste_2242 [Legionella steelei]|uniref:Coiled coil protein n=1 Tax=Legionella steelei TaxID=947033 RepID=A0A0W0ZI68_9GAMM|nr:hypothetical protein [Legionella steelei]KTD69084.1 hypothetical protein Lste_2242 [Legionella steelei]
MAKKLINKKPFCAFDLQYKKQMLQIGFKMKHAELQEWVQDLEQLNRENEAVQQQITRLKKILAKPNLVTVFNEVKDILGLLSDLDNVNYQNIRTAEDLVAKEFISDKLYEFQSSLSQLPTIRVPTHIPPTVEQQIEQIYKKYKLNVEKEVAKIEQQDDVNWHKLFLRQQIRNKHEGNADSFVDFSSIYARQVNLQMPEVGIGSKSKALVDYTKVNNKIPKKAENKDEELLHYSMTLSEKSFHYKGNFEAFKKQYIAEKRGEVQSSAAHKSLADIIHLIERTQWTLGKWGSSSEIDMSSGAKKAVPNHIYEIYMKAKEGRDDPPKAVSAMEEIHQIATRAANFKPTFFKDQRKRDETTQNAYDEIASKTGPQQ